MLAGWKPVLPWVKRSRMPVIQIRVKDEVCALYGEDAPPARESGCAKTRRVRETGTRPELAAQCRDGTLWPETASTGRSHKPIACCCRGNPRVLQLGAATIPCVGGTARSGSLSSLELFLCFCSCVCFSGRVTLSARQKS